MKKYIALILAALLALSTLTAAFAATYTDKETVKKVQQALNDAGYNCGTPDGVAGKKTAAAITQYQTDKGLEASGEIDDALLESMGIAVEKPEAPTEATEQPPEQTDSVSSENAEANQSADLNDPQVLAMYYNYAFLLRLDMLGIDYKNEDIGQDEYQIYSIQNEGEDFYLNSDKMFIGLEPSGLEFVFWYEPWNGELSFLDHAALYAFFLTVNGYYKGSTEEAENSISLLGEAPARDGTVSIEGKSFDYHSNSYEISGYGSIDKPLSLKAQKPLN